MGRIGDFQGMVHRVLTILLSRLYPTQSLTIFLYQSLTNFENVLWERGDFRDFIFMQLSRT